MINLKFYYIVNYAFQKSLRFRKAIDPFVNDEISIILLKQKKVLTNFHEDEDLNSDGIQTICEDNDGQLWAGGYMGLFRLAGDSFTSISQYRPW